MQSSVSSQNGDEVHSRAATPRLLEAASIALRSLLQSELRNRPVEPARVRRAVRLMCDDAHRQGLHAEQLLIVVKQAWASLPEAHSTGAGSVRRDLLTEFIRTCIDEFYRTDARSTERAD